MDRRLTPAMPDETTRRALETRRSDEPASIATAELLTLAGTAALRDVTMNSPLM